MESYLDPKYLKRKLTRACDYQAFRDPTPEEKAGTVDPGGTLWTTSCNELGRHYYPDELSIVDKWYCDHHAEIVMKHKIEQLVLDVTRAVYRGRREN